MCIIISWESYDKYDPQTWFLYLWLIHIMFPQVNKVKKNYNSEQQEEIREEAKAEDEKVPVQPVGNHGMAEIMDMDEDGDDLDSSLLVRQGSIGGNDKIYNENEPEEEEEERLINPSAMKKLQEMKKAKKEEAEIKKEKDPVKLLEKLPGDELDELVRAADDVRPKTDPDNVSMVAHDSGDRKKRKYESRRRQAEALPEAHIEGLDKINDLEEAGKDMKPAGGFNFVPVQFEDRPISNKKSRFLSRLGYYSGKTLGKLIGLVANAIYWPILWGPHKLINRYWKGKKSKKTAKPKDFQEKRRHDLIPGWDGAKFSKQPLGKDEFKGEDGIDVDFRKIPGVWSQKTAAEAEDSHGHPLDPVISVFVAQPDKHSDQPTKIGELGHTFLGLEFSHYSKVTERYERYQARFGLFQTGFGTSTMIVGINNNATLPAQLMNDANYQYDIGRSYPAKPWQVNAIMKASETYADKGYNYFSRNCTTFVKEMVVDQAHIMAAQQILGPEEFVMGNFDNFGLFGSAAFSQNGKLGTKHLFEEMGAQDDMIYERMGNKRTTKEDYDRYIESMKKEQGPIKFGSAPNTAGMNMRRLAEDAPGTYSSGSSDLAVPLKDITKHFGLDAIAAEMHNVGQKLYDTVAMITPPELRDSRNQPQELREIIMDLPNMGMPFKNLASMIEAENDRNESANSKLENEQQKIHFTKISDFKCIRPSYLKRLRTYLKECNERLDTLLRKYYHNDKRLHYDVLDLMAVIQEGNALVDSYYNSINLSNGTDRDLGMLREDITRQKFVVSAGGQTALLTPSHYESYLQIYKTPEKAVRSYARLMELLNKRNRSGKEEAELAKLERMEKLAKTFDVSHTYMIDKDGFKQKDIDYAFALGKKERQGSAAGEMINAGRTASYSYKALMLDKVFGGILQRVRKSLADGSLTPNMDSVEKWLDDDLSRAAEKKMNGMLMIFKAAAKTLDKPDKQELLDVMNDAIMNGYLNKCLDGARPEEYTTMGSISSLFGVVFSMLLEDKSTRFGKIADKLAVMTLDYSKQDSLQRASGQAKQLQPRRKA